MGLLNASFRKWSEATMLSVISGFVVTGAGVGGVFFCRPRNGEVRWFAVAPVLDWLIPTGLVAAMCIGVALIVSGVSG
jgi:hypothetical protein